MRELAQQHGYGEDVKTFIKEVVSKSPKYDLMVDDWIKSLADKTEPFVLESRLGWYFLPNSYKILLWCDMHERSKRAHQKPHDGRHFDNEQDAEAHIKARDTADLHRYEAMYGIKYEEDVRVFNPRDFNLCINTAGQHPDNVAEHIKKHIERHARLRESDAEALLV
jgi:CMP/dCMP kinase